MKTFCLYFLMVLVTISSCKKGGISNPPDPPAPPRTLTVVEIYTNVPISGATVSLQKCNYDIEFGCLGYTTHTTKRTNSKGQITFASDLPVDAIIVKSDKYWRYSSKGFSDTIALTPISIVEVSVKRINAYAPGDKLFIGVTPPNCFFVGCIANLASIGLPTDTLIYLNAYGYSDNVVSWYVNFLSTDTLHSSPPFHLNAFDSAHVAIEY